MPRLALIGILILALFALPLSVGAQQARIYRIGVILQGGSPAAAIDGYGDGLRSWDSKRASSSSSTCATSRAISKRRKWRRGVSKARGSTSSGRCLLRPLSR